MLHPSDPTTHPASESPVSVRRGLLKRWSAIRAPASTPATAALLERVLAARGLSDPVAGSAFLDPRLSQLHDPSGIPDLDRAAGRLLDAARAGDPIVIYGDYDVDGVTAIAILTRMVRAIAPGAAVSSYIPHRVEEGYGLNSDAIRQICEGGARLIVSVDCGVTAIEPAVVAAAAGVDLIITDHHNPPASVEALPRAYAVVHPRRPDSAYAFTELSGAGVAYKLAWRLATLASGSARVRDDLRGLLIDLLALAALGTIADVVPLVGENRVIARHGLSRIQHSPIVGLRALVEASGLAGENVDAQSVGFKLAPRLNACGRMGHAREAAELLITGDEARAAEIADRLTSQNEQRRKVELAIFERACELAESAGMTREDRRAIVLADASWHTGVVGIVCSRLVERYSRPCILMGIEDGLCHGSGRSIDGFSLHAALAECSEWLVGFGGHDMAAGLRVDLARLPGFVEAFTRFANANIAAEELCGSLRYDTHAQLSELTVDAVRQLDRLEPFGRSNPAVKLHISGLRVAENPRTMGGAGKHMALQVKDRAGVHMRMVAWGWGERAAQIRAGRTVDAIVTPRVSTFSGVRVEPTLEDLHIHPV